MVENVNKYHSGLQAGHREMTQQTLKNGAKGFKFSCEAKMEGSSLQQASWHNSKKMQPKEHNPVSVSAGQVL
jgi:hypothetical protein